jgi:hypothetical protein
MAIFSILIVGSYFVNSLEETPWGMAKRLAVPEALSEVSVFFLMAKTQLMFSPSETI